MAPIFFDYHKDIIFELENRGAIVDWLPDRPFRSNILRGITTIAPFFVQLYVDKHYQKILYNIR